MSYDEDIYKLPEDLNEHFIKMKKVRSDFLDSVGLMEINIKKVIARYFLSDFNRDWPVFSHMLNKVESSFSDSIEILNVILKTPQMKKKFSDKRRREWYNRMGSVRKIRHYLTVIKNDLLENTDYPKITTLLESINQSLKQFGLRTISLQSKT